MVLLKNINKYEKEKEKKTLGNRDILKVVPCLLPSLILTFVFHLDFVCFIKVPKKLGSKLKRKGENWVILMVWAFLLSILCTLRTRKREGERERREEEKEKEELILIFVVMVITCNEKQKKVLGFEL
jgi:heme/copper-type cytochrome/quinol oxidase subunit 2